MWILHQPKIVFSVFTNDVASKAQQIYQILKIDPENFYIDGHIRLPKHLGIAWSKQ